MKDATVVAGASGLGAPITRMNMMEVPDVLPWVRSGEVLVTSGYPLKDFTDVQLIELIDGLHASAVAAVVVKLGGRYLGQFSEAVRSHADRLRFPLIAMPLDLAFTDLQERYFAEVLQRHRKALDAETRSRIFGESLGQLINDRSSATEDELREVVDRLGIPEPRPVQVMVLRSRERLKPHEYRALGAEVAGALSPLSDRVLSHPFGDHVVLVALCEDQDEIETLLGTLLASRRHPLRAVRCGVGNDAHQLVEWRHSYRQAIRALELTRDSPSETARIVHFSALGLHHIVETLVVSGSAQAFARERLSRLADHPDLIRTLHVALQHNCAIGPTSERLHFHYNTIRNRLHKVEEILGPVFEDGKSRAELLIACEIWTRLQPDVDQ